MIYKSLLLTLFLVPFTMTNNNLQNARIQELEEAQFQKECEISELNKMIVEKNSSFHFYKSNAYDYLASMDNSDSKAKASLDQLITSLKAEFDNTKNITLMFQEGLSSNDSYEMVRIALLRVILEERFIEKLILKFEACIQELIEINIELMNLKRKNQYEKC